MSDEYIAYRERGGIGDPVGFVIAENKTQAAKLARTIFGPGTYNCRRTDGTEPAWLRETDPAERARLEQEEFDRIQTQAYAHLRRSISRARR